jgi:23S rRNA pseudouridine1911/1915/1917 synthase
VTTLGERLRALFPEASGRAHKQWLASGRVRVDGRACRDPRTPVAPGARVEVGERAAVRPTGLALGLQLVHEDASILVADKPPGLLTVASEGERERTAYRAVWEYLAATRSGARPFIVHRLDRETSGLLVFACTPAAKGRLQEQFAARAVERGYAALVHGRVREEHGTLVADLVQDAALRVRTRPRGRDTGARTAITNYRVVARRRDTTVLELTLDTGRRQQIRVQLAELGHPIVGDRAHGAPAAPGGRLCLHACRLGFTHPTTGARMRFESPPPDFARPR